MYCWLHLALSNLGTRSFHSAPAAHAWLRGLTPPDILVIRHHLSQAPAYRVVLSPSPAASQRKPRAHSIDKESEE